LIQGGRHARREAGCPLILRDDRMHTYR
jgi:hypothetical protein